jgi:hypothetical protein
MHGCALHSLGDGVGDGVGAVGRGGPDDAAGDGDGADQPQAALVRARTATP